MLLWRTWKSYGVVHPSFTCSTTVHWMDTGTGEIEPGEPFGSCWFSNPESKSKVNTFPNVLLEANQCWKFLSNLKKNLIPQWFGKIFTQNLNFAWKLNFWGNISWIVIEKLVKPSWDKIIWGKLLSTSAGMLFLYCNMSFWQVFYDEICICSMYSDNLALIYYPTLIWQVFTTKNIGGKLLSTSAGMEFPKLSKH